MIYKNNWLIDYKKINHASLVQISTQVGGFMWVSHGTKTPSSEIRKSTHIGYECEATVLSLHDM